MNSIPSKKEIKENKNNQSPFFFAFSGPNNNCLEDKTNVKEKKEESLNFIGENNLINEKESKNNENEKKKCNNQSSNENNINTQLNNNNNKNVPFFNANNICNLNNASKKNNNDNFIRNDSSQYEFLDKKCENPFIFVNNNNMNNINNNNLINDNMNNINNNNMNNNNVNNPFQCPKKKSESIFFQPQQNDSINNINKRLASYESNYESKFNLRERANQIEIKRRKELMEERKNEYYKKRIFNLINAYCNDIQKDDFEFISISLLYVKSYLEYFRDKKILSKLFFELFSKFRLVNNTFTSNMGYNYSLMLILNVIFSKPNINNIGNLHYYYYIIKKFYLVFLKNYRKIKNFDCRFEMISSFLISFLKYINIIDFISILRKEDMLDFIFERYFSCYFYRIIYDMDINEYENQIKNKEFIHYFTDCIKIYQQLKKKPKTCSFICIANLLIKLYSIIDDNDILEYTNIIYELHKNFPYKIDVDYHKEIISIDFDELQMLISNNKI